MYLFSAISNLNLRHISCFAHSLNLVVQGPIHDSIKDMVDKVKSIVQFFKQSPHAMAKLTDIQKNFNIKILKLKQGVPTRRNSTFEMLDRINKNKEAVTSALALCNSKLLLVDRDWKVIRESVELLQIFSEVT